MDPTITDLITAHIDRTGDSYDQIARRGGMSKALIGRLAILDGDYSISPATIPKLAAALRLPIATIQRAAARTAGYAVSDVPPGTAAFEQITDDLAKLDADDVDRVRVIVRALLDRDGR